jgi:hypothetical protein
MLGRLFSKLLWAPHQGSADSIFGTVDDHDNGGPAAGFAESNPDLQFGEIWDRKFYLIHRLQYFLVTSKSCIFLVHDELALRPLLSMSSLFVCVPKVQNLLHIFACTGASFILQMMSS